MRRLSSPGVSETSGVSLTLKISLFATGCAGIVAEYVLSTLATYLLGNAIFQWTLVMSLMLFAMGLGSRLSRRFRNHLLDCFILTEFILSCCCAVSAILAYGVAAYTDHADLFIYAEATVIGVLIGFEIPLVTRINESYEELRLNISAVMEKDYYGALAGGLLFAFVALPYLGLTYTPILLGAINFSVAALLLWRFRRLLRFPKRLTAAFSVGCIFLVLLGIFAEPIILHGEQKKYRDKIILSRRTPHQKIVMTRWKSHYWLYINGQEQFSTFDEERYHEPLVHPAMLLANGPRNVLVLGGGDGLAVREILKHETVEAVTLVDLDPEMTDLARGHPILLDINRGALNDPRVRVINGDAAGFVAEAEAFFDVIIADLPDPDSVDLMHLYDRTFYETVRRRLSRGGLFVTQATSPYFSNAAFLCILKTMRAAGLAVLPYQNPIPTMGQWGWVLAMRDTEADAERLKSRVQSVDFGGIETRFINRDAVVSMVHFGKGIIDETALGAVEVNSRLRPVLYRYYLSGRWGVY